MKKNAPNILLIIADQMRGDCLSLLNHPVVLTPTLDRIGGAGVTFTRAYTPCASCIAARRSLLTGLKPSNHGIVGYRDGVELRERTVTEYLRDHGYHTALAGRSMHQSPRENPFGFEKRVLGSVHHEDDDYGRYLEQVLPGSGGIRGVGLSCNGWNARPWPYPEHYHPVHWTVERARELLHSRTENQPLFLTTGFYAPHPPLIPPEFYLSRYLSMDLPIPPVGSWVSQAPRLSDGPGVDSHFVNLPREALCRALAGYYGMINYIDDRLFYLLSEFREQSEKDGRPWVIVFMADHGDLMGDHHLWRKCEPYEGATRVPLMIQWSEETGISGGRRIDAPVTLTDLMPTLLELAGIELPPDIDGRGLGRLLREPNVEPPHEYVHSEHAPCPNEGVGYHMLTDGREKYIWHPVDGTEHLFDLTVDPQEKNDLINSGPDTETRDIWRRRLIAELLDRPEGFTNGTALIPGRPYAPVLPQR